jgi:3-oxoacyl-(acyl-carrier-protein) synthase III
MYVYTEGHSRIAGTGIYLPEERVTTRDLMREIQSQERFGVSYEWLERVTGIREKRVTPPGILPSDMAVVAAKEAMERAKVTAREVDAIIYTGLTRDYLEPATAHIVQAKLDATNAIVFDVSNACHGFMNGIHIMDALIATGQVRNGLVVTGEQGSALTRRALATLQTITDRTQFVSTVAALTLGDAGAATILQAKNEPTAGLVGLMLQSQGQHANLCVVQDPVGEGIMSADMPSIIDEAAKLMADMFYECMYRRLRWQIHQLAKYLIHQVGNRAFQIYSQLTGVPTRLMPKTVDVLGNLITANIPVNIYNCVRNGELKAGDKIYISSTGSGISLSQAGLIWDAV